VLLLVAMIAGLLTAWSGLYGIAASRGHWPGFERLLSFGMRSSVRTHALGIDVPALDDPERLRRGAAHYQQACAPCHGSPAGASMLVARSMLPEPSNLNVVVPTWRSNELFWIVKHGLKYTGMPAWPTQRRDDEVWDTVAFLRELPGMDVDRYRALAGLQDDEATATGRRHDRAALLASCARCHGIDGRGRDTTAFPRLDLHTEDWLLEQLRTYAEGRRASAVMQVAVAELAPRNIAWLAAHYAAASAPASSVAQRAEAAGPTHLDGEALFREGDGGRGVPACVTCHAREATARNHLYPALLGQYAGYTATQLRLYRDGHRASTDAARLMATIAGRMTDAHIEAVAAYLAAQPAD
jgi:cytochrome c553